MDLCIKSYSFVVSACDSSGSPPSSHLNLCFSRGSGEEKTVSLSMTFAEYTAFLQMTTGPNDFYYSAKYEDDEYEYRHVHVTKEVAKMVPKNRLMSESEWRSLGIQQSPGWVHYMIHGPERHVLLFRRPLPGKAAAATQGNGSTRTRVGAR